jgi:hypothetical protein
MRGFIPDDGENVYEKKYGDCKDMSSLIVTMLNCAGIKGHFAWTGTRHIPYSYEELPLPKTDNHMIAVYLKDSMPVILDGTINYLNYGLPPYLLQDKELLVSIDEDNYKVYKVPVLSAKSSMKKSVYDLRFSKDTIIGIGSTFYKGYNRSGILYTLGGVKESDIRKVLLSQLSVGSNKFNLLDHNIEIPKEEKQPVNISYSFQVPGYVKSIDGEVYVNMNIDKSYANYNLDTTITEVPLENDFCFHEKYITNLEIPLGYEVDYLPKDISFENDMYRFNITYKKKDAEIIQEKDIYFSFLILEKKEFENWNHFVGSLVEAYREVVVLKQLK